MADVVIYGATPAGVEVRRTLPATDRALCYADVDVSRIGATVDGLPVVHAAALISMTFDRVQIAARDAAGALTFLLKLGVPLERLAIAPALDGTSPDRRPTAIVYGSALAALRTLRHIESDYRVLCFCDADPARQGTRLADRFVVAPADLCAIRFDRVFLGVAHTYRAFHDLLWHWNVPFEKMDVVPESVLCPAPAPAAGGRPRYVIFGAGSSGQQLFTRLSAIADVVAFIDNSQAKHGQTVCDRPVHAPADLATLAYDRVAIGSMFAAEMLSQLMALGIDSRIIDLPDALEQRFAARRAPASGWTRLLTWRPRWRRSIEAARA